MAMSLDWVAVLTISPVATSSRAGNAFLEKFPELSEAVARYEEENGPFDREEDTLVYVQLDLARWAGEIVEFDPWFFEQLHAHGEVMYTIDGSMEDEEGTTYEVHYRFHPDHGFVQVRDGELLDRSDALRDQP